ncbi:ABC-type multidrug transport system fused ATPase/permease subunit [Kribbella aluminosa]|uniref:ABC-type multidrug transport system fused ATPase/permease subunit n=1 Tax=Kribbella aluminosa TaxID=416017 RepID=A0ABS4UMK6_9ACTN|nr:ABC transporter ATP-binding protein [Kribbella aluminosa]MBP2352887.1 ABC-type multidrug transport system fused ATPase/permease subunit [Kribbella aluminosa]
MSSQLPVAGPAEVRAAAIRDLSADRRAVVAVVIVNGLASAAGLAAPWLLGRIIDTIRAGGGDVLGAVDRLAFGALVFTVVQTVLAWWALKIGYRFGERTAARVRERFLSRTLALPPRAADHLPAGDLIARGSTDASLVASTLRSAVPEVLVALMHALFLIVAVLVLDFRLGLCGLVCLLGVGAAVRWYLRRARPVYLAVAATGADLADAVVSTAKGARTVELLGLERRRVEVTESAVMRARTARLDALWLRTVLFPWVDVSLALPVVGVLLVGGALYAGDLVSLGVVVTATVYLRQLVGPLDTLMLWIEQLQGAGASYARVEGLADIPEPQPTVPAQNLGDRIQVRDAHFSYTGARDVLRGIDLLVQPGERLAIVGTSGAGKSTLARLLAGLDRPRTGSVTIGGTPVAELPPEQLREHVVLITQDHHVFHDSVRDNLLIAKPDATDKELYAALEAVGRRGDLDTEVGTDLDDAGAQQLSLARVVLADPHTVILDEATALLDPKTARRTEQSLAGVLRGRTVIAIAHRLQTAHDADRIAVMEAGELVELGTHGELVSAGGVYGQLWRAWHGDPAAR